MQVHLFLREYGRVKMNDYLWDRGFIVVLDKTELSIKLTLFSLHVVAINLLLYIISIYNIPVAIMKVSKLKSFSNLTLLKYLIMVANLVIRFP